MLRQVEAASSQAHPRPLLEALLEHARAVLAADHVSLRSNDAAGWVLEARFREPQRSSDVLGEARRAQALHRSLIVHGPAVTYVHLRDGTPLHMSPQIERMTGIPVGDWLSGKHTWSDVLHPDDQPEASASYGEFMDRGESYRGSYRIVHRDGTVHWVDDQAVVLHGANGEPDVIQGVAIDVTASKEAELALRWSERQLREMVSGLRLIAVFTDMDGRITDVNPEFERVTGWRLEDVAGRMWAEVCVLPDDAGQHTRFQAALAAGRPITHLVAPLLLRDGSRRLISWNCSSLFDGAGRPTGTAGIGEDITDRAAAERALRESEERYRGLAEYNVAGVWQTDADDRLVYVNPALCRMLGVTGSTELLGRPLSSFLAVGAEGRASHETELVRLDGQRRTALVSAVPLRGAESEPAGALGTLVDVSDLRNAEAALRESESRRQWVLGELLRAEQAERARIAAELHDDTVQVMAATLFSLDRLEHADGADAAAHVRTARELLAAATERTRRLMFELRPPLLEAQGLGPALNELAIQFRRETGVEVRTMLSVHRYQEPIELLVYRVVQEAVSNCRKHARASHLLIVLREDGPAIAGEVRDDGRGFDAPAALDRSRMRLHLGLDAMRERVLLAGGEYLLDTAPGAGTRIAFTIPLGADI